MRLTRDFVQAVREILALDPLGNTAAIARDLNMPEAYVIMAMPVPMRMRAHAADLEAVWQQIGKMQAVTLTTATRKVVRHPAPCPNKENIGFIWLVSLPKGQPNAHEHSVRFFDTEGHHCLTVDLDNCQSSGDEQLFLNLKTRFGIIPNPPKRHACKGCGRCTPETCCQGKGHGHHGEPAVACA